MATKKVKCSHCNGTGQYQRHTSYLVGGKPVCFRCQGTGFVTVKAMRRRLDRQAGWQIVGPFSNWPRSHRDDDLELPY